MNRGGSRNFREGVQKNGVSQSIYNASERAVIEFPCFMNPHRKVEEFYDVEPVYKLIRNIGTPTDEYEFSEEL